MLNLIKCCRPYFYHFTYYYKKYRKSKLLIKIDTFKVKASQLNHSTNEYEKKRSRKRFVWLIRRLKQEGYLKTLKIKNESAIVITSKGMERIFKIRLKLTDKKPRKDGKWQMVLFDIPESKRRSRDYFRRALQYLGYQKLQKSIWVCQYDVMQETKNLIKRYSLKEYTEILLIQKIGLG